jgi:23S rRNA (uridine2552-2'-O)-methyltransferase
VGTKPKNPYRRPDAFTKAARAQGYPARSVFKLEEIDRRVRLLRPGQRVIDLGAAPGSWSMYAAQKIGKGGKLYAIDLSEITVVFGPNVTVVRGDALAVDSAEIAAHGPYDVVLSDMAPATSGSKVSDQTRSFELFMGAVAIGAAHGAPGSSFVGKIFMSEDFPKAKDAVRLQYEEVRVLRPEGTRAQSSEVFVVGLRLRPKPSPA